MNIEEMWERNILIGINIIIVVYSSFRRFE